MKPIIITDSNCDLSQEYLEYNNIISIPFRFQLNDKDYEDIYGQSITHQNFYHSLRLGDWATSTQINPYRFEKVFSKYVTLGYAIIYIGFSSGLSDTYNSALLAKKAILERHKSADISVIDTKGATSGQGLLVHSACNMLKQGRSKEDIVHWIEKNKLNVNIWFTVDSLDHLKRGGRISPTSAALGSLIDVKPILMVNKNGKLVAVKKVRRRKKAIKTLAAEIKERIVDPHNQVIFVNHGDCAEDAYLLKSLIEEQNKVKDVILNFIGPVIGAHSGPGTLSAAFIGQPRDA